MVLLRPLSVIIVCGVEVALLEEGRIEGDRRVETCEELADIYHTRVKTAEITEQVPECVTGAFLGNDVVSEL